MNNGLGMPEWQIDLALDDSRRWWWSSGCGILLMIAGSAIPAIEGGALRASHGGPFASLAHIWPPIAFGVGAFMVVFGIVMSLVATACKRKFHRQDPRWQEEQLRSQRRRLEDALQRLNDELDRRDR